MLVLGLLLQVGHSFVFVAASWVQFCVCCCRLGTVLCLLMQVGYSIVFVVSSWV